MSNNLSLTNPTETISFIMEEHIEDPESNIIPPLYMLIPPLPPILEYVPEILPLSSVNEDFANPFESDSANEYSNATNYQASTTYDTIPAFTNNESIPLNTIFVSTIERLHHQARVARNRRIMNAFYNSIREDEEAEEEMIRHVMRESFDDDQQKRLIDVARELDIHTCEYDKDSPELSNHSTCRICFEDYVEKEEIGILQCKHFFHNECIQEWGKRKPNCPYCDIEIPVVSNEPSCKKQKTN
jgi:hypothetical protein